MKLWETSWTLFVVLALCPTRVFAQDQKQDMSPIDPNAPLQPLDATPSVHRRQGGNCLDEGERALSGTARSGSNRPLSGTAC
jgi:hypothetical protein